MATQNQAAPVFNEDAFDQVFDQFDLPPTFYKPGMEETRLKMVEFGFNGLEARILDMEKRLRALEASNGH